MLSDISVLLPQFQVQRVKCGWCSVGDIIDGWSPKDRAASTLDLLVSEFDKLGKPHYHIIGNHCLYNLPRKVRSARSLCCWECNKAKHLICVRRSAYVNE